MHSVRQQRVRELLKRQIGEVLQREFRTADIGLLTVTDVDVAGDLKSATVYVGVIGSPDQRKKAMTALDDQRLHIQELLGRALVLKHTPRLRFELDTAIERGNRVLAILDELDRPSDAP